MIELRPMRDDEVRAYLDASREEYADDIERNGGLSREEAERKAEADLAALAPGGRPGPEHALSVVEQSGRAVGQLWITERERAGRRTLYVYDVRIDEAERGRGLGKAVMLAVEDEARRRGITRIDLNVFGGNEVARSLYRSLGYAEHAVWMGKEL